MKTCNLTYLRIILVVVMMTRITTLHAQQDERKLTLHLENVSLKSALKEIEKTCKIRFSYNPGKLPLEKSVSISVKEESLHTLLSRLLQPLEISFQFTEDQVILKPATKSISKEKRVAENQRFTLSGTVRDMLTGEVIIGANIYDKATFRGTTSNAFGFYSLTLPEGQYDLAVSMVGYKSENLEIALTNNQSIDFKIKESAIDIQEVVVISDGETAAIDPAAPGSVRLTGTDLRRMAGFAGNADVLKSLQSAPGFSAFGDGSSFYYVRGGNHDQNLLLIDDAPVFNPAHLFGFFTAIAPDAIKDVKAYKGDFPANYGGRLSSVIDIRARDGNMNNIGFSGNLGIFTSDLTLEGPVVKETGSFILSGRKSNLNWLNNNKLNGRSFTIDFYDLNAKANIRINRNNRLYLTAFYGRDDFSRLTNASVNTFGISWDNTAATLRWNHIFSNKLFSNTTAVVSQYNYYLYISRQQDDYWKSSIRTRILKSDFSWFPAAGITMKFGAELAAYHSNPGNVHFSDEETRRNAPVIPEYNSLAINGYISNEHKINEKLAVRYGLRLSSWRNPGPGTVYLFDAAHEVYDTLEVEKGTYHSPYFNLEPRLSVTWTPKKWISFTAGYSRTVQYIQMLSNSTSPFTSLEVWAPSGPVIRPQKADLATTGISVSLPGNMTLGFEGFYKQLYNQTDYRDHANMLYNPLIEGELRFGKTRATGLEVMMRKHGGRFTGWAGYTFARAMKNIEGINGNREFPAHYDHPHSFSTHLMFKAGKKWDFAAQWNYMTGGAFTSPVGFMQYDGYVVPVYGEKHNDRYPAYHRLDLSVSWMLNKPDRKYRHHIVFAAYNVYGRENPFSLSFNKIMNGNGDFVVPADLNGAYEIIPTQLSVSGVIPSINYIFKFQ